MYSIWCLAVLQIDFHCTSAPREPNFDLWRISFCESLWINIAMGRHSLVFRLKHFENFLEHHQTLKMFKKHFFAVAIIWKALDFIWRPDYLDTSTIKCKRVQYPSYHLPRVVQHQNEYESNAGYNSNQAGRLSPQKPLFNWDCDIETKSCMLRGFRTHHKKTQIIDGGYFWCEQGRANFLKFGHEDFSAHFLG